MILCTSLVSKDYFLKVLQKETSYERRRTPCLTIIVDRNKLEQILLFNSFLKVQRKM
jgi:hypothetical protein